MSEKIDSAHDPLLREPSSRNPSGSQPDQDQVLVRPDGLEQENARLQGLWDSQMEDKGGNGLPNRKTFALLITWDPDIDELSVADEVTRLEDVLRDTYNYTVFRKCIKPEKHAQHQVRKILADFVLDNDNENTLLIVYYAGHGSPGEQKGHLILDSERIPSELSIPLERKRILWHEAENSIKDTEADVLVIFDCCYAGNLVLPSRGPKASRNFEFMGATNHMSTTSIPGEKSFTSALIWSLEEFAKIRSPFTIRSLLNKITMEAPSFPREQVPICDSRHHKPGTIGTHIVLAIDPKDGEYNEIACPSEEERPAHVTEIVDLRICFVKHPDDADIKSLASAFKNWIGDKRSTTQRVQWVRLQSPEHLVQQYARQWRRQALISRACKKLAKPELKVSTTAPSDYDKSRLTPPESLCGDRTMDLLDVGTNPDLMESPDSASSMIAFSPSLESRNDYEERRLFSVPRRNSPPLVIENREEEERLLYHVYGIIKASRELLRYPEFRWASMVAIFSVAFALLWLSLSRSQEFAIIRVFRFNITRA